MAANEETALLEIVGKIVQHNVDEAEHLHRMIERDSYERGKKEGYEQGYRDGVTDQQRTMQRALGLIHDEPVE